MGEKNPIFKIFNQKIVHISFTFRFGSQTPKTWQPFKIVPNQKFIENKIQ